MMILNILAVLPPGGELTLSAIVWECWICGGGGAVGVTAWRFIGRDDGEATNASGGTYVGFGVVEGVGLGGGRLSGCWLLGLSC